MQAFVRDTAPAQELTCAEAMRDTKQSIAMLPTSTGVYVMVSTRTAGDARLCAFFVDAQGNAQPVEPAP